MTTAKLTPSHYAHVLRAIADGELIEWKDSIGNWVVRVSDSVLKEIANAHYQPKRYRVKPKVIIINGMEVPEPLREIPSHDTVVFWPSFEPKNEGSQTNCGFVKYYPELLQNLLSCGLLHLTEEAANTHALALISFTNTDNTK